MQHNILQLQFMNGKVFLQMITINIIIDNLQYLVNDKRIELNVFVIMNNHILLIRQALVGFTPSTIQVSFMKYTAQQIKRILIKVDSNKFLDFKVNKYDRDYQI